MERMSPEERIEAATKGHPDHIRDYYLDQFKSHESKLVNSFLKIQTNRIATLALKDSYRRANEDRLSRVLKSISKL
jgi:hypothetical protein